MPERSPRKHIGITPEVKKEPNLPNVCSKGYRNSLLFTSVKEYGMLSSEIKKESSLKRFTYKCKLHILENLLIGITP